MQPTSITMKKDQMMRRHRSLGHGRGLLIISIFALFLLCHIYYHHLAPVADKKPIKVSPSSGNAQEDNAIQMKTNEKKNVCPSNGLYHVKAVEIGTSNFHTLIQEAENENATGLSVDAMQVYIDQLPNRSCWEKLAAAVVGKSQDVPKDGLARIYFVHPDDIEKYKLPWWLKGCNSVNRPHPSATSFLKERNLSHLQQNKTIPVLSVGQLLDKYGICRIGTLKVDVEGLDGDLLIGFSEWVKGGGVCYADKIMGEFNELSEGMSSFEMADEALKGAGYKTIINRGENRMWEHGL